MEKQESEMKRKLETEMGTRRTNHWCNIFFIVYLVITLVFYLVIGNKVGSNIVEYTLTASYVFIQQLMTTLYFHSQ